MFVRDNYNLTGYPCLNEIIRTRQDIYACTIQLELDGISMLERDNYHLRGYLCLYEIVRTIRDIYA